MNTKSTI